MSSPGVRRPIRIGIHISVDDDPTLLTMARLTIVLPLLGRPLSDDPDKRQEERGNDRDAA